MRLALLTLLVPGLAQAEPTWNRLYSASATTATYLKSAENPYQTNYHPHYALDDDPTTAWSEGLEGDGEGTGLVIPISPLVSARALRLVIFNGDQTSPAQFAANAAPKTLLVSLITPDSNNAQKHELRLERTLGPQTFDIPLAGDVGFVQLAIGEVYPGSKSAGTRISDVQIFVAGDVKYNARAERAKRDALRAWKTARLAESTSYAALPLSHPYASTRFEQEGDMKLVSERYVVPPMKPGEEPLFVGDPSLQRNKDFVPLREQVRAGTLQQGVTDADKTLLRELDGLMKDGAPKAGAWHSFRLTRRVVMPDNVSVAGPVREALNLSEGALTPASGPGKLVLQSVGEIEGVQREARSNLLVLAGSAEDVKKVYFTHKFITEDRSTMTETTHVLALYAGGKLSRLVSLTKLEGSFSGDTFAVGVAVPTYTQGKVSRLESTTLVDREGGDEALEATEAGIHLRTMTLQAEPRT